jgi:1-acyl-sn-glycerol-3-phosphate acyltransferase
VDSVSANSTVASLGAAVRALRAGMPLFVFPEGARTPDGTMQPFLAGAAFLAIRAQVPLVPIALSGVYDLLPMHTRHFYPGEITLTVGEPISTAGMPLRQVEELNIRLRTTIEEMRAQAATIPSR